MQARDGASSKKKTSYDKAHKLNAPKGYIGNTLANPKQVGHKKAGAFDLFKKGYNALEKANNAQLFYHKKTKSKSSSAPSAYSKMKSIENASKSVSKNKPTKKSPDKHVVVKENSHSPVRTHTPNTTRTHVPKAHKTSTHVSKTTSTHPARKTTSTHVSKTTSTHVSNKVKTPAPKASTSLEAKKKAYINSLKKNSDAYYKTQSSMLTKQRDNAILQQKQVYQNAVNEGKISQQEANDQFAKDKKAIDQQFYQQAQATNITAYDNGIQNSMQMLGLKAGDNVRQQDSVDTAVSTRDQQINNIKNRLASLASTRDLNIAGINSDYNNNIAGARGQADQMYNSGVSDFMANDYSATQGQQFAQQNATQQHDWSVQDATQQHNWDVQDATTAYKRSLSARGSSGGGGSVKKASSNVSKSVRPIAQAYNQYKASKQNTGLDQYYKSQTKLNKGSVVQKNPVLPPVPVNYNQSLSPWQKYKIVMGG